MKRGQPLAVLLDEGAPIAMAAPFEERGYRAVRHGDVLAPGAKDHLVAAAAILNGAALIATDRDMRQMAKRFGNPAEIGRFEKLNLIFVNCSGVLAPKRVSHLMSLIEHEWHFACAKAARTMWIEIGPHYFRSYR